MGEEDTTRGTEDIDFDEFIDPEDFQDAGAESTIKGLDAFIDFVDEPAAEAKSEGEVPFSPDDLYAAIMTDVPQDDEEDLQEVENLAGKLREMGYTHLDFDYETLSFLEKRGAYFKEEAVNILTFTDELSEFLGQIMQIYAGSKASLQIQSSGSRAQSLHANLFHASDKLTKGIVNAVYNTIQEILINGGTPEVSEVYDVLLRTSPALTGSVEFMQKDIFQMIATAIPVVTRDFKKEQKSAIYQEEQRKNKAQLLFPEEQETMYKIGELGTEKISFIRQVRQDGRKFYLTCPDCGREFSVNGAFVTIIAFPTESGPMRRVFPRLLTCKCGRGFLFTQEDYLMILKNYLTKNSSGLANVLHSSTSFCKGASFLRINPPASMVVDALPGVVYSEADGRNITDRETKSASDEKDVPIVVDDAAFRDAVRQFYFRLKGYQGKRNCKSTNRVQGFKTAEGHAEKGNEEISLSLEDIMTTGQRLTYEEVSYYFCECLSLDYRETKNRALFSLISFLNENEHLSTILDCKRLFSLKNNLVLLEENLGSVEKIPYDKFVELAALNRSLGGRYSVTEDSAENRKLLYDSLLDKVDSLSEMIQQIELDREKILTGLERHKRELGFCRILNVATIKLNDLDSIVTDERVLKLFSEVADMMIVNSYAEQFFTYWSKLRIVRRSTLQEYLTRSSGQAAMKNGLFNILKKIAEDACSVSLMQNVDRFKVCYLMSADLHKGLNSLYQAYLDVNFYRFCRCYKQIPSDLKMFMGRAYDDDFFQFICGFDEIASKTLSTSEYEFFLCDFSHTELEGQDKVLSELSFGRYVLKRRDNESLEEYVKRWRDTPYHEFCRYDVYDNAKLFDCLMPWISTVVTSPMLYLTGYRSYAVATFITTLVQVLCELPDGEPWKALGISESHLAVIRSSLEECRLLPDKYGCSLAEDACRVPTGYYFSSAGAAINDMCTKYENIIVRDTFDLNKKESLFSIKDEICRILNHGSYLNEDGEAANDEEDIAGEFLCYVRNSGLRKLVRGQ